MTKHWDYRQLLIQHLYMRIGAIIFARMSSTRLPGKMMMEISGRPLLELVVERAKRINGLDALIFATSTHESDDVSTQWAQTKCYDVFRGDLENVANRALVCAREYRLDAFLRICGDRPFHSPQLSNDALIQFRKQPCDLLSSTIRESLPPGLTVEVVRTNALEQALRLGSLEDREHITAIMYRDKRFHLEPFLPRIQPVPNIPFVIDTIEDLHKMREVAALLHDPVSADISEIIISAKKCFSADWKI